METAPDDAIGEMAAELADGLACSRPRSGRSAATGHRTRPRCRPRRQESEPVREDLSPGDVRPDHGGRPPAVAASWVSTGDCPGRAMTCARSQSGSGTRYSSFAASGLVRVVRLELPVHRQPGNSVQVRERVLVEPAGPAVAHRATLVLDRVLDADRRFAVGLKTIAPSSSNRRGRSPAASLGSPRLSRLSTHMVISVSLVTSRCASTR